MNLNVMKRGAAVARAYKRGGMGAGLFALAYYRPDSVREDEHGQLVVGDYAIPEKLTHVPWMEHF